MAEPDVVSSHWLFLLTAAGLLAAATPQPPAQEVSGKPEIASGDQMTVSGTSVRLYGVAAPAAGQTCQTRYGVSYDCYRRSTDVLKALVGEAEVACIITTVDRTGQKIGVCRVGGVDLAAAMVARGWAFAYRRLTPAYVGAEAFAESHRLGMWAGKVEMPWQWRSRQLGDKAR